MGALWDAAPRGTYNPRRGLFYPSRRSEGLEIVEGDTGGLRRELREDAVLLAGIDCGHCGDAARQSYAWA